MAGFPGEPGTSCVRQSELSTPESKVRRSRWTKEQETQAIYQAGRGLCTEEIADCIGICSGEAVRVKLQRLGVSLRNQAKYRQGRTIPVHLPRQAAARIYMAARKRNLTSADLVDRILKMVCQDRLIDPVLDDL